MTTSFADCERSASKKLGPESRSSKCGSHHGSIQSDPVAVLKGECERVNHAILGLSERDFALPTRCAPWDVKALVAHMYRGLFRVPTALEAAPPASADTNETDRHSARLQTTFPLSLRPPDLRKGRRAPAPAPARGRCYGFSAAYGLGTIRKTKPSVSRGRPDWLPVT
jgi:hypothetical protein